MRRVKAQNQRLRETQVHVFTRRGREKSSYHHHTHTWLGWHIYAFKEAYHVLLEREYAYVHVPYTTKCFVARQKNLEKRYDDAHALQNVGQITAARHFFTFWAN